MKILITGGAGFIGKHLARELELYGHNTLVADRNHERPVELANPGDVSTVFIEFRPDLVVHLAARYGRILCEEDPSQTLKDNVRATIHVAQAAARYDARMLYTSSSEVYGDHGTKHITERTTLRQPTTIYGLSKKWGEEVCHQYVRQPDLIIVRPNMIYGPGQQHGRGRAALANFIQDAMRQRELVVHANATRSWLYISDAVRALRLLIEQDEAKGVFHLSNDHQYDTLERQAQKVWRIVNGPRLPLRVEFTEPLDNQILVKNYSSEKLEKLIGWEPEVDFEEGVQRQTNWMRGNE